MREVSAITRILQVARRPFCAAGQGCLRCLKGFKSGEFSQINQLAPCIDRRLSAAIIPAADALKRRPVAPVAELVDALDSKSSSERSAGSIPARGTNSGF